MNELEAKQKVVDAGIRLVESGLIARTWGNVSCRISRTHFVITPSGRNYLSLTTSDIVSVCIADLSYEGSNLPSGEKGIHAEIYDHCPDVNFVIHTHQENASVLSAMSLDSIPASPKYPLLGGMVICTPYALPGSKKIRQGVGEALEKATGNALILKSHGAVCYGKDDAEAFLVATQLEEACAEMIASHYQTPQDKKATFSSKRTASGFVVELPGGERLEVNMQESVGIIPRDLAVHLAIYRERKEIQSIHHVASGNVLAFSQGKIILRPLVDDFAQIIGTNVKTVEESPNKIAAALKKASAVFIEAQGALCCGANEMDVKAVEMILEKCCKASLCGEFFGGAKSIGWLDSRRMRRIYLKKYSKQIKGEAF